jgi:hypothetical protein
MATVNRLKLSSELTKLSVGDTPGLVSQFT